jgi:hypothetical protein
MKRHRHGAGAVDQAVRSGATTGAVSVIIVPALGEGDGRLRRADGAAIGCGRSQFMGRTGLWLR